jgi:hypothetical protein
VFFLVAWRARTSINYYDLGGIFGGIFVIFLVVLALFIGTIALEGYIVSLTKKRLIHELRLINEFIKFAQPVPRHLTHKRASSAD